MEKHSVTSQVAELEDVRAGIQPQACLTTKPMVFPWYFTFFLIQWQVTWICVCGGGGGVDSDVGHGGSEMCLACSLGWGMHQGKKSDRDYSLGPGKGMEKFAGPRLCQTPQEYRAGKM